MRPGRLYPARQRPDRSFEWQSGTRTGRDIFVASYETYWRNGWVLRGDLVQLNRILEIKTELRLFRGLRICHRIPSCLLSSEIVGTQYFLKLNTLKRIIRKLKEKSRNLI